MPQRATCLIIPALVSFLAYVALATLAVAPAVAAFAAGYLWESGPIRDLALWLWPDAWLTADPLAGDGAPAVAAYVAVAAVLVGAWLWAVRTARPLHLERAWPLLAITAVIVAPLVVAPRLQSSDVFLYDMYGRIISLHGGNPILQPPLSFPQEPLLSWVVWDFVASSYGPLWLMLSAAVSAMAAPSVTAGVIAYRLVALAVHLATAALLWRLLRRHRPHAALSGTLFYAWNPLVALELVGNTHNDGLVALFAVALLLAAMQRAWVAAAVAGACAVMVKPFAVVLFPILARQIVPSLRDPAAWRSLARAAAAAALAALVLSVPLWAGAGLARNVLENPAATEATNSVWELAGLLWADWSAGDAVEARPYLTALRALLFVAGLAWICRAASPPRRLPAAVAYTWVLFCLCVAWVWPWYLVPALAVMPAAGLRLLPAGVGLTVGGLLFWAAWPAARPSPLEGVYQWRSLLLFGPALAIAAWAPARAAVVVALGGRRRHRRPVPMLEEAPTLEVAPGQP